MLQVESIMRVVDQANDLSNQSKSDGESKEVKQFKDIYDHLGNRILFQNLSFKLQPGEILAVQGESGVGKTQILRGLCQLDTFTDGYVTLNNKQPRDYGITNWRARVAFVQQKQPSIEGTPRELFKIFCSMKAQKKLQKRLAADGQIESHRFDWLVQHLESIMQEWNLDPNRLDQIWAKLSGGEHQRMCLAMAVALSPEVLLLDEPTSALDERTTLAVENTIRRSKITCVWVTHSPNQALRIGNQSLFLSRGAKHELTKNDKLGSKKDERTY